MWWDVPSRLVLELSACSVLGWKSPIHVGAFIVETEHHPNSRTLSPPLHWQWLKDCLLWSDALVLRVTSWHVRCTRWRKPTRMPTFQVLFGQALAYTRRYGKPLGGHILTCSVLQIDWIFPFYTQTRCEVLVYRCRDVLRNCSGLAVEKLSRSCCQWWSAWLQKTSSNSLAKRQAHDIPWLWLRTRQTFRHNTCVKLSPETKHHSESAKTTVTAEEMVARLFCWFCPVLHHLETS